MTGDDQDIAANALAARRLQPVGPAVLDELDELILVAREELAQGVLFVRRVDRDRADGLLVGARRAPTPPSGAQARGRNRVGADMGCVE
jgi:hypothetical protein